MTRRAERTILAVVHNVTAATRLFDVLPVIADDPRVQVQFACPDSSPFRGQIAEYFTEHGVTPVSWESVTKARFDLAITASHGGPLPDLNAPVTVLPHGMGYNKYLTLNPKSDSRETVFGLSPEWLVHDGRLIASSLVLSHPEQLDRLRESCPEAADIAVVAGDPSFDRMLASLPLRHQYREALGVRASQRLVLISSTWGDESLFAKQPDLPLRLREALPLDDYAIAVALHPNIWSLHNPWQVRRWLHAAQRSGVAVLPADEGWRAALVAADLVVGDQGSVTFYGAALDRPVLLAEAPLHTVDPASAVGRFVATADRLATGPLLPQIERATGLPSEVAEIAALATSAPLKSFSLLRTEFYRLLDLSEPDHPAEPSALPVRATRTRDALVQAVEVVGTKVVRFAAESVLRGRPLPDGAHLVVHADEPTDSALQLADVLVLAEPGEATWVDETLAALPGASAAVRRLDATTWLMGTRDGHLARFQSPDPVPASVALASNRPLCTVPDFVVERCTCPQAGVHVAVSE